jgi:uncharacterized membrane protein
MAFCQNCGTQSPGAFCPNCGAAVAAAGATAPPPPPGATPPPPPGAAEPPQYQQAQPLSAPGMSDNVAGALCYLATIVTGVIFLILAPYNQSKFVRFHAFQSIFLFAAWVILSIVITIIHFFFGHFLLWLIMVVLWLYMMYSAFNNKKVKLPIIGDLAEKQA